MNEVYAALKHLARRYHGRWSAIDDALTLVRSSDGASTSAGERTRRMLVNAFRVQTYPDSIRDTLRTDRANALRDLGKPLSEALGHIITIELAEQMLGSLNDAEAERRRERSDAEHVEKNDAVYGPFIKSLNRHGIVRGHHNVLTDHEWSVVARYIRRKVEQRIGGLPPIRSDKDTRTPDGRLHPFLNPYRAPRV